MYTYLAGSPSKGLNLSEAKGQIPMCAAPVCHLVCVNGNMVALLRGCNLRRLSEICFSLSQWPFNRI